MGMVRYSGPGLHSNAPKIMSYLKTYRKKGGLTQDEVAFLLGCESGTKISRFEHRARQPNLETAFACQVVFGIPAHPAPYS